VEQHFGPDRFWTTLIEDEVDGFSGLRLHREARGKTSIAAECVFWDAAGNFTFKTVEGDVPIEIVQGLIAETQQTIKVR
jgi:hypothetical protein